MFVFYSCFFNWMKKKNSLHITYVNIFVLHCSPCTVIISKHCDWWELLLTHSQQCHCPARRATTACTVIATSTSVHQCPALTSTTAWSVRERTSSIPASRCPSHPTPPLMPQPSAGMRLRRAIALFKCQRWNPATPVDRFPTARAQTWSRTWSSRCLRELRAPAPLLVIPCLVPQSAIPLPLPLPPSLPQTAPCPPVCHHCQAWRAALMCRWL